MKAGVSRRFVEDRRHYGSYLSDNNNFAKIKYLDDRIVLGYNKVTEKHKEMSEQEVLLRDLLVSEQVRNQLTLDCQNFINIKSQHYTAIWNTIDHSSLQEDIELISRYLFHKNICTIHICQIGIFSSRELKSTTITVHREVLELEANEDFLITCEALSGTHISNFHNLVGQKITMHYKFLSWD